MDEDESRVVQNRLKQQQHYSVQNRLAKETQHTPELKMREVLNYLRIRRQ